MEKQDKIDATMIAFYIIACTITFFLFARIA